MDKKIRDIMTPDPVGVYYDQTLAETARVMRDAGVGAVLVVNGDSLSGVVTDRDLVVRGLAEGAGPDSPVGPVCSAKLVGVDADAGVAEAQRLLLPRIGDLTRGGEPGVQFGELSVLAALAQRCLQLKGVIEMILDRALGAAGDEVELLNPSGLRLFDGVVDEWPVDDRQHFLRHGLGCRENAGAEPGDGKDRLAYALLHKAPQWGCRRLAVI
jgi:CBS domain-containing protein